MDQEPSVLKKRGAAEALEALESGQAAGESEASSGSNSGSDDSAAEELHLGTAHDQAGAAVSHPNASGAREVSIGRGGRGRRACTACVKGGWVGARVARLPSKPRVHLE